MTPDSVLVFRKTSVGALGAVSSALAGYAALEAGSTIAIAYGLTIMTVGVGFGVMMVGVGAAYGVSLLVEDDPTPPTDSIEAIEAIEEVASVVDVTGTAMRSAGLPSSFGRLDMATFLLDKALEGAEESLRDRQSQPNALFFRPMIDNSGRYVDVNGMTIEITW